MLTTYDKYVADHRVFEAGLNGVQPDWLRELRQRGLAAFETVKFPTASRGNERWKYTNVRPIASGTFAYPFEVNGAAASDAVKQVAPWDERWDRLVFVDGHFSDGQSRVHPSSDGVRVERLGEAAAADNESAREHLGRYAGVDDDGFTAVNTAFLHDGAFVHVPDETEHESAIHLVFVSTGRTEPTATYPRTLILVGRHSRLTVVESYVGLSQRSYFTDAVAEIVVDEGGSLDHYRYLSESPEGYHIGTTRVRLGRDSRFRSTSFARGAALARNDLQVVLDAPGASCDLNGLYLTSGRQHIDNHIDIDHAMPHTSSEQYFKGILADRSRAVFSGRVLVRPGAQKTYALQADKNLLLSEGARVNTKPSLEIFADDVQCFHGATVGAVPDEALFYMRSRGIDEETARDLLIHGFASEIIERVALEPLRDFLDKLFSRSVLEGHKSQRRPDAASGRAPVPTNHG